MGGLLTRAFKVQTAVKVWEQALLKVLMKRKEKRNKQNKTQQGKKTELKQLGLTYFGVTVC